MNNILIIIILVSVTENFAIAATKIQQNEPEQRILLRKLQNIQQSDSKDSKSSTWNEILADVLVNKIKIFSLKTPEIKPSEPDHDTSGNNKVVTKCFSQLLKFFKKYIYDPHVNTTCLDNSCWEFPESSSEVPSVQTESETTDEGPSTNPKDDVEIVEPRYHGRLKNMPSNPESTTEFLERETVSEEETSEATSETTADPETTEHPGKKIARDLPNTERSNILNDIPEDVETFAVSEPNYAICPEGLVFKDGLCESPRSKLILSVPYQCPSGYWKDRRGYCRRLF